MTQTPFAQSRYNDVIIVLHWLTLVAIAGAYVAIELHESFPKGSDIRAGLRNTHFLFGLGIFALAITRVSARLSARTRLEPAKPTSRLAAAVHLSLYIFMLAMPVLGWLLLSAEGKAASIGAFRFPALIAKNPDAADWLEELHEAGATLGYILIALHAAAALLHHYLLKDGTVRSMKPSFLDGNRRD